MIHPATYESVREAVEHAFELFPLEFHDKKVWIKPNVLRASEAKEGIVTNPAVLRAVVDKVELQMQKNFEKEVKAHAIGELVMDQLHIIDQVAYVRFASVYRQFKDINQFMKELKGLLGKRA